MEHRGAAELAAGLEEIRAAPQGRGTLELIVRRPAPGEREVIDAGEIDSASGLAGDCWLTRGASSTPDGSAEPACQITVMSARAAALIAGPRERWPLAGDQLYVDLDLSAAATPAGARLRVGDAVLEVTAEPHLGCGKFVRRFGVDAMKLVSSEAGRRLNLRGINARVITGGEVRTGDEVLLASS